MRIISVFSVLVMLLCCCSCGKKSPVPSVAPDNPTTATQKAPDAPIAASGMPAPPATIASGADWPNFLGPNKDGIAPGIKLTKNWSKPLTQRWAVNMDDKGHVGPAVAGGVLYIVDHSGNQDIVRALDVNTGTEKWRQGYATGSRENYGFNRATPSVVDGKVYIISSAGIVRCLDAATGGVKWECDMVKSFGGKKPKWEYTASPLIDGDNVIVCPGGANAGVVALDNNTGTTRWRGGGSDQPGYATPVAATLNGKKQYVIFTAKNLIGVAADSGNIIWQFPWVTQNDVNAATPLVSGNSVFITSNYNRGCALVDVKGSSASARWENKEMHSHFSTPLLVDGHVYGTTDPGDLVCIELATGKTKWRQKGFEKGGVCGADGTIIAMSGNTGALTMAALSSSSYQELGRFTPLGGDQSWTAPIIANGYLIVRNKQKLACFNLL